MSTDILDTPEAGPAAVRGATLRVVGYGAGILLSVGSAALVLRYLGEEAFGRYTTIFSLVAIVMGITDAGTSSVGVREHAVLPPAERERMLANLQGLRLALTTVGVMLAIGYALLAPYDGDMVLGTVLGGIGLVITVAAVTLWIPLQAELKLGRVTALELVRQAATVVALVAIVVAGGGVAALLGAQIPAGIVLLAVTIALLSGRVPIGARLDPPAWWALLRDTLPFAAATAVGVLYSYVAIIVMSLVATDAEVGNFGAAHRVFYVLTAVPGLLVATAFPVLARAARDDRDRLRYGVQRLFETSLVVGAAMAIVVAAGAPVAIDVVAGAGYDEAVPALRVLGLALLATALIAVGGFTLLSLRRHKTLLLANAVAFVTTAAMALVLAETDGAHGVALAVLIGEVVLCVLYFGALARTGTRPSVASLPRVALAAGLAAVPGFALGLPPLAAVVAAGAVYAVAVIALRALPVEAIEAFTSLRRDRAAAEAPRTRPPSAPS